MKTIPQLEHKNCHPISSFILDCFYREIFKACPHNKFGNDNTACLFLKNYTIQCGDW